MVISLIPQDATLTPLSLEGTMDFPHGQARATKTKLVNGSSHINDKGYIQKDRTANVVLTLTSLTDEETLEYWHTNGSGLWFSDDLGVYKAEIYSLNIVLGVATLELWITSLVVATADI